MARFEAEQTVTQSLLERLIDRDPGVQSEPAPSRAQSVRLLKASLRRDVEWLLNTRRTPEPADDAYPELARSSFNFGLPDVTTLSYTSGKDRARLARMLESTLAVFEPRLDRIKVTALDPGTTNAHVLRFQIEGLLLMDPAPEHISFDTVLQLSSGEYQVKGEQSAG
jgi:type VI secretion system protein ImpF